MMSQTSLLAWINAGVSLCWHPLALPAKKIKEVYLKDAISGLIFFFKFLFFNLLGQVSLINVELML